MFSRGRPLGLGQQRWSIRGEGTDSAVAENWGRYQNRYDMLQNWQRIGVVLQSAAIGTQNPPLPQDWYLEVESQLVDTGLTPVVPFPNFASETDLDHPSAIQLDPRELFFKLLNINNHPEVLDDARSAAYDPISSQGIHKAVETGLKAGRALAAALGSGIEVNSDYAASVSAGFEDYRNNRNYFYRLEKQWSDSPFWRRRRERTHLQWANSTAREPVTHLT